ncbi:hypothetical protein [Sphingomonas sp. PB4P5]|uniref:hypothetical protein n=1 Tax=Parasphingomonas puruogangriensis TaxID=3096155 RepID=UPI002FCB3A19
MVEDIKNELTARLGRIAGRDSIDRPSELAREIDSIRALAHRAGLRPAVAVAQALEMALARGERGPLVHAWLDLLRDAVGGDRHDAAACDSYRAACAVRMFG